jgi:uncharacterized membrane protein HdeD (DUF308 family)
MSTVSGIVAIIIGALLIIRSNKEGFDISMFLLGVAFLNIAMLYWYKEEKK